MCHPSQATVFPSPSLPQPLHPPMTYNALGLALLEGAKVGEDLEGGAPALELVLPVEQDGGRHDDEVRAPVAMLQGQVGQQGDGHDGLPQTHLIRQDACGGQRSRVRGHTWQCGYHPLVHVQYTPHILKLSKS